jgi:Tol biopolymer transport system component
MPLAPGVRLGPYEILEAVGAGGMGEVYRARDTRLGRTVAIKTLPGTLASTPGLRERLIREARTVAALDHPNICGLHDIGSEGGVDFLVMPYIEGEMLTARLSRGPLPVPEALRLARQIASALEAAHESGTLHRDLKPSNIKIAPDGNVRLLDFGLAKTLHPPLPAMAPANPSDLATALTQAGTMVGTPRYMSPEQILGGAVDKRSDVWAFGCVLYEMLAGRRAFDGSTVAEALGAAIREDPDWNALPAATPRRVRELLHRCLRKEPGRRLRDLGDAALEIEEASAKPEEVRGNGTSSRRRILLAWTVAAVFALAAALALLLRPAGAGGERSAMHFSAVTTFSGVATQPSLSPDGRSVAFVSNHGGQWDLYIGLVTGGDVVRLTNTPEVEAMPRWSPDGSRLLFARTNERGLQDLWLMPALGGVPRRLVENGAQPAWSHDGRSIAYVSGNRIWICDPTGENPRAVTTAEPLLFHDQPSFSHDGRSLAYVRKTTGPYGELEIVDLGTGRTRPITHDGALAWSPVWSPDDRSIYFTSSRGGTMNIWMVPAASGTPERITAGQGADMDIDLSADGTRLVYSSFRSNVNLAEVSLDPESSGQRKWLTSDASRNEFAPRYSPDGRRIAYFSNRTGAEREAIWTMDANGENAAKVVDDRLVNVFPHWSGDGRTLFYLARPNDIDLPLTLRRVPVAGGVPQDLPVRPFRSDWGDLAPDGRLIAQTSASGGEIFDTRTQQRRPIPDLPAEPCWSRDGRRIAYAVRPGSSRESDEGLWVGEPEGPRRQIFHGWVVWFAWGGPEDILIMEGRPDFNGVLSRVDLEGRRRVVLPQVSLFRREHEAVYSPLRFDVHPDGRRIVIEALEFQQADLGMIDHLR